MTDHKDEIAILSFYSFTNISDPAMLQPQILLRAKKKCIYGTVLVAPEGLNGSISGKEEDLHYLIDEIRQLTGSKEIISKVNYCEKQPFTKVKVKIKKEIVALKHGDLDVENLKGEYIETKDWDEFISRDDVIMIDTRNSYEVKVGTFENAIDPKTETFSELPGWTEKNMDKLKDKKVAMFCTGGIRCEKSTALLKDMGVEEVFHLKGGILQYLEDTKNINNSWKGECFVFDDRGAVSSDLLPSEGFWVEKGQTAKGVSNSK
jgi:UPF0176 protein